jgi:glutamine amidotransferase
MRVVVVDYGSGNLRSAVKAFERAARESGVSAEIILSAKADQVANADRVVLPGCRRLCRLPRRPECH